MIIVEGPDGAGKTTLVSMLCEELGVVPQPRACTSEDGPVQELRQWVERNLHELHALAPHERGLWDRHPLFSEPIYGPIVRGHMREGFANPHWFRNKIVTLENMRPLVIFCLPPWETVEKNIALGHEASTEHLKGVLEKGQAIWELYAHLIATWPIEHLVYDYTHTLYVTTTKSVIARARKVLR